jgi:hypothetical protein
MAGSDQSRRRQPSSRRSSSSSSHDDTQRMLSTQPTQPYTVSQDNSPPDQPSQVPSSPKPGKRIVNGAVVNSQGVELPEVPQRTPRKTRASSSLFASVPDTSIIPEEDFDGLTEVSESDPPAEARINSQEGDDSQQCVPRSPSARSASSSGSSPKRPRLF